MAGTLYIIQPMATNKNHECSINGYLYDPSFKYKQINCFLTYLVINTIIVSVKVDMAANAVENKNGGSLSEVGHSW